MSRIVSRSALVAQKEASGKNVESIDKARDFIMETLKEEEGTKFQFCFSAAAARADEFTFQVPMIKTGDAREELLREFRSHNYKVKVQSGPGSYSQLPVNVVNWKNVSVDGLDTFIIEI